MNGVVGGTVPAKLWRRFMTAALAIDHPARAVPKPAARPLADVVDEALAPELEVPMEGAVEPPPPEPVPDAVNTPQ